MLKDQQIASVAGEGVLAKINKCTDVSGKQWGGAKASTKIFVCDEEGTMELVEKVPGLQIIVSKNNFGNIIIVHKGTKFQYCKLVFTGYGNRVYIGKTKGTINGLVADFYCSSDLIINDDFATSTCTIRLRDESNVFIGKDCLFSSDIFLWTSDGHAIFDGSGKCINYAGDIYIGDHVWLGHGVEVLKHSVIKENSVVGCKSVVCKQFLEGNVVLAGVPAKIVKQGISWDKKPPRCFK